MVSWYLDEGLVTLRTEWRHEHPDAVVYTIGDASHLSRDSEHNPEPAGTAPGADQGEVDAADFMHGHGVTDDDLADLFAGLAKSRDSRILYLIHNRKIISSVVEPWEVRDYHGSDPHTDHVHVSVNDRYDKNTADWPWEARVARSIKQVPVSTKLPEFLQVGDDDDMWSGYNHVARAQALANWMDNSTKDVDTDGVYGPLTAAKFGRALKTGKLTKITTAQLKQIHGLI